MTKSQSIEGIVLWYKDACMAQVQTAHTAMQSRHEAASSTARVEDYMDW